MDEADFTLLQVLLACGPLTFSFRETAPPLRLRLRNLMSSGNVIAQTGGIEDLIEGRSTLTVVIGALGRQNLFQHIGMCPA